MSEPSKSAKTKSAKSKSSKAAEGGSKPEKSAADHAAAEQPKPIGNAPDMGKIVVGLIVAIVLVAFPVWFSAARAAPDRNGDGQPDYKPLPQKPTGSEACIESTAFMRASHMDLLIDWRDTVVRGDDYDYVSVRDGQHWQRSLSKTCMSCHTNQQKFCGECHDYLGVTPDCWHCHVEPENSMVKADDAPPDAPPTGLMDPTAPHEGRM